MRKPFFLHHWFTFLFTVSLLAISVTSSAERYAVLVGISHYPLLKSLEGPINDVALVKKTLVDHWQFKDKYITVLTDQQADKASILETIKNIHLQAKANDTVFIYFSGHGTSAADTSMGVQMGHRTGAFIPYDIDGISNENELRQRILIGNRDLRPILNSMDQSGLHVFVAIDACYSGNTVRGRQQASELQPRFIHFSELINGKNHHKKKHRNQYKKQQQQQQQQHRKSTPYVNFPSRVEVEPYPYENIVSLSAAQENEIAHDIPASMLDSYPTIDHKPHGAFTDSLVRVLSAPQTISHPPSYAALSNQVQALMRTRGFSSTPAFLPNIQQPTNVILQKTIFDD